MPEKDIISLDQAQMAAERFLEDQFKNLKKLAVDKVKLGSIENILIYDVAGIATIGGGMISKSIEQTFKVQVSAVDGTIVGYDWQRTENNK
jgi:hypothetical protein